MWQDLRHGLRMLGKNPGFTALAVLSFAIGVGANAAMFGLADTMVLRPLTIPRPTDLVTVSAVVPRAGFQSPSTRALSYPDFEDIRTASRSFERLFVYQLTLAGLAVRADQPPERTFGMAVSGGFFDAVGVQPVFGRGFGADEDQVGGRSPVVVLDHDLWVSRFASDPSVVGRHIRLGGTDVTVVGVMPAGFTGPDQFVKPGFYLPAAMLPAIRTSGPADQLTRRDLRNFVVKGYLAAGVSLPQAAQEMALLGANLRRAHPETNKDLDITAVTELTSRVDARPQFVVMVTMLMLLSGLVLLVACANVAGLLTSRAPARTRELALRMALGAGRARLTRQLLLESLLLAAGGGVVGLGLAFAIIAVFQQISLPTDVPLKLDFVLDGRAMAVGLVVAALSAVVAGLVPAWRSTRADLVTMLKDAAGAGGRRGRRWGSSALVVGQVALALVLLTASVFLYRAFALERQHGPGFRTDHMLLMAFDPALSHDEAARTETFYRLLTSRVRQLAGVTAASLASAPPMDSINIDSTLILPEGFQLPQGTTSLRVRVARVDEGYFDVTGIRIVRGRAIRDTDTAATPRVAIANETLARRYWPGRDPIGRRLRLASGGTIEIVGVAADATYRGLGERPTEFLYYPVAQDPVPQLTLLVHTMGDPAAFATRIRQMVRGIDPDMIVSDVRTMEDFYEATTVSTIVLVEVVGGMGMMGLALAIAGLYGLVAHSVSRRTREIGVRMSVGASPSSVRRMVLGQGLRLAAAGTLVGIVASLAAGNALRAVFAFPTVPRVDVSTYVIVVPLLIVVAACAAYVPARRASRIDPLAALRQD
jgi:macrolide transport system ATP-binding/permease protein